MIDWSFALLFRPDIVKISLESEVESIRLAVETGPEAGDPVGGPQQVAPSNANH
jgi:hypothetical protein